MFLQSFSVASDWAIINFVPIFEFFQVGPYLIGWAAKRAIRMLGLIPHIRHMRSTFKRMVHLFVRLRFLWY